MLAFASFNRRQPPARQTKVVDNGLCPLKSGSIRLCVPACANDAVSLKPASVGRVTVDVHAQATCEVCACGTMRCKTCKHVFQGRSFMSNVTRKWYTIVRPNSSMDCATESVVYSKNVAFNMLERQARS